TASSSPLVFPSVSSSRPGSAVPQISAPFNTSRPGPAAPRGSAAATAGLRRRRLASSGASVGGGGGNMLRFYTEDAPGLKISPTVVLVISICFIGFVTALHVFGKLYRNKVSPPGPGA
ncbi:Protein transport protein Sec61 subunit beta, partial [Linum grandiflorum]